MKMISRIATSLAALLMIASVSASAPPAQIIYRFDDHRYLELVGYYCQGALNYVDTKRGIKSELYSQFYQAFGSKFIHPSDKYIAIPSWEVGGFTVSKDYGQTWQTASISGNYFPSSKEAESITVVNDRGYLLTKDGRLYVSSAPFDDLRVRKGGAGIDYIIDGETKHLNPLSAGPSWGLDFVKEKDMPNLIYQYLSNWQDFPQKVPEVKNYQGWDHMKCNPGLGLEDK